MPTHRSKKNDRFLQRALTSSDHEATTKFMTTHGIRILIATLGAAWAVQPLFADTAVPITVQKEHVFVQTGPSAVEPDPTNPFLFYAQSPLSGGVTPPVGPGDTLTLNTAEGKYEFEKLYLSQAGLDAGFPDGTYTFEVSTTPAFTLSLTGDHYPNMPLISNGTWNSSGDYMIDPTKDTTITFNNFTTYGTQGVGSHEQISIRPLDGSTDTLTQSYVTPTNTAGFTSYTIPAGSLAPGSLYLGLFSFDTIIAVNDTAVTGQKVSTNYTSLTGFKIVTSGTASDAPVITTEPTSQTAPVGSTVTFNLAFSGTASFQWFKNGAAISNTNNPGGDGLILTNIQSSDAASYYAVVVAADGSFAQTPTVTLSIGSSTAAAPTFTNQPQSRTLASGSTVVFRADAQGTPAPTYQWYFNGSALANANGVSNVTGPALVVAGATSANAGTYYCVVTNPSGSLQSFTATLTVVSTNDVGRLINLSCRASVGTGANILIAGFASGGSGTSGSEPVLIRGSGPALVPFGVGGTLADPQLQLYTGSTLLATNDGWAGNAAIASAASSVGAFAWSSSSSHDAAFVQTLASGAYTAQVSGQSGDTGVSLAEVYDATPTGTYTPSMPRLINLSARVEVGTGGNILIAGFVIGGTTAKTVLIRASGPALIPFGVGGTLKDPQLQLYSGSTLLGSNAGWGGGAAVQAAAASVGAFAWNDTSSLDSALLVTLQPGAYTAQVAGASGDTGVALVEVYEIP
jgi:Immunoglobulin domain/Immunoglobulin I-set domain